MKFVIDNYANGLSTQPLYLHKHISERDGHEVKINAFDTPVFDLMDEVNPDVYITSCHTMSKDLFVYMKENQKKQEIKLLINADDGKLAHVNTVRDMLKESNISYKFFGTLGNHHIAKVIQKEAFRLPNCTDLNIHKDTSVETRWHKRINNLIFAQSRDDLEKLKPVLEDTTYHVSCRNSAMINDLHFDIVGMCKHIFHNYDQVIFCDIDTDLHQMFFESLARANKTYFMSNNADKINEKLSRILRTDVNLNIEDDERRQDFTMLKTAIEEKHTSKNRTNTLLSQLPQKV